MHTPVAADLRIHLKPLTLPSLLTRLFDSAYSGSRESIDIKSVIHVVFECQCYYNAGSSSSQNVHCLFKYVNIYLSIIRRYFCALCIYNPDHIEKQLENFEYSTSIFHY